MFAAAVVEMPVKLAPGERPKTEETPQRPDDTKGIKHRFESLKLIRGQPH